MTVVVNSNSLATVASGNLSRANRCLKESLARLSSGKRIVSAADDAAGLSVAYKLKAKSNRNHEIRDNLSSSRSFLDVQQGALQSVGNILSRIAELKTMSLDMTKSSGDNENYDKEFKELQLQLGQISHQKFNGVSLFSHQIPEVLFGDAVGLELLEQAADEDYFDETVNITRWGIKRFLSKTLESGDKLPSKFGENPAQDILSFVLSDEARGSGQYNNSQTQAGVMQQDIDDWTQMIGERNIDGKIALIAVQKSGWGSSSAPDELLPQNGHVPEFASIYENYPRDINSRRAPLPPSNQQAVSLGLSILKNAFLTETNNGQDLPAAMGLFIDSTGSVVKEEVDDAAVEFMDWVKSNYPSVTVSNRSDGSSWGNGIYSASSERWIQQARIAVEDLLDNDSDFIDAVGTGSLSENEGGIKTLLDSVYDLDDFDMSELVGFIDALSNALAVNGAEAQAVDLKTQDLQEGFVNTESAHSRIMHGDFALDSARFARRNVLVQASAAMLVQANQLTDVALALFSN